jgi:tRNA(adenine34) deaminase
MTPSPPDKIEFWMRTALEEARLGAARDEVPVGAVVVDAEGRLLSSAHDERNTTADPTAHAEILALRRAASVLGDWRLENCDMHVTLEPCPMCAGALILARIRRVYYGATSPKSGAVESLARVLDLNCFNHKVEAQGGVLVEECGALLSDYFRAKRKNPG